MPSFMFCSQFEQFTYFDGLITCPTFFSFSLISRVLEKVLQKKVKLMIIVTLNWQTQASYPILLEMSHLLLDHPLIVAWKVTGNSLRWKEFQAMQPNLLSSQED